MFSTPYDAAQAGAFALAVSRFLGWSYFISWSVSFYPQLLGNYQRQSVTGLALDFFAINVFGYICYTISTVLFLFSPTVRDEYARRHPGAEEPTVKWNDLAFTAHALLISTVTLSQFYFWGYKRDASQRMSRTMVTIAVACIAAISVSVLLAISDINWQWIDVVYTLQYTKIFISIVKYIPQAYLNYQRKATTGWSIHNILLDITGGALSLGQLVLDSSFQGDWSGLTGNPIKFFLGQVTIVFDILFIIQHYILYRHSSTPPSVITSVEQGYGSIRPPSRKSSPRIVETKPKRLYEDEPYGSVTHRDEERRGLLSASLKEQLTSI